MEAERRDLSKVTQQVGGKAGAWTQVVRLRSRDTLVSVIRLLNNRRDTWVTSRIGMLKGGTQPSELHNPTLPRPREGSLGTEGGSINRAASEGGWWGCTREVGRMQTLRTL